MPLEDVFARGLAALQGNGYLLMARAVVGDPSHSRDLEHLRQVTAAYRFALTQGQPPLPLICTLWNVHYKTAASWTSKARRTGVLTERWKPHAKDRWAAPFPGKTRQLAGELFFLVAGVAAA